jgi:diaminopimelate decarboxylase
MLPFLSSENSALAVGPLLLASSIILFRSFRGVAPKSEDNTTKCCNNGPIERSKFMTSDNAAKIKKFCDTPVFVYDEESLRQQAEKALNFPNVFGLTVRFAMKSCPNATILKLFYGMGVNFDASSGYEVKRAIKAGIKPAHISLSSQELPEDFGDLIKLGIEFNACSLKQLEAFGKQFPGTSCGIRFNPGKGSGGTGKTVRASVVTTTNLLF